ncbi:MAG: methyltransferase domain-containing protein [Desulfobacterales bacterium]|nr:methyltransferase domain-containing protein [Desulfobacterales bacterium]MBF0398088.1 methyltransferase domain-containing protein [Desulfobacterales bacterium]
MHSIEKIKNKFFKPSEHPYRRYENKIFSILRGQDTILDAGCGRAAPVLKKYIGKAKILIGVDLEEKAQDLSEIKYIKSDISNINISSSFVDVVISRAVLEHVFDPASVFNEVKRILKPGGSFIFLTPNLYDYVSIFSMLTPQKFHKFILPKTGDRRSEDIFPVYYRANTYLSIKKLCQKSNLEILSFEWIGQYPFNFMFNPFLFFAATVYEKIISKYESLRFLRGWILVHIKKNE